MTSAQPLDLKSFEPLLRDFLPPDLYVLAWTESSAEVGQRVYEHLRTLLRILQDYVPRHVADSLPVPGEIRFSRQTGTLMFSDLANFTPVMEAAAARGRQGAEKFLEILNAYFAQMIEILSKSGGELLEFTGDALLAVFPEDARHSDTARAVRAGLRMQQAMSRFSHLPIGARNYSLQMRVGIHYGSFLSADVGTPQRMEHVLLGRAVYEAKQAETSGQVGRVCLTETACARVGSQFQFEPGEPPCILIADPMSTVDLGDYDLALPRRRSASHVLWDRSPQGILTEIETLTGQLQPLACYLPPAVLKLVVESANQRQIAPEFPMATVIFANLGGVAEAVDHAHPEEEAAAVGSFSRTVALINAAVERWGGILKKITYHSSGSNGVIFFGVPGSYADRPDHAVEAARAIREVFQSLEPPLIQGQRATLACRIGIARGLIFAGEVGEPHGRREYNILGDPVNTAARLMHAAAPNQILGTREVALATSAPNRSLGLVPLKGKAALLEVYEFM